MPCRCNRNRAAAASQRSGQTAGSQAHAQNSQNASFGQNQPSQNHGHFQNMDAAPSASEMTNFWPDFCRPRSLPRA